VERIDYLPVLSSFIAGELARIRNCSELEAGLAEIGPSTEIGDRDLGIDSLGLLQIASGVSQMFHLSETGVDEYLLRYRKLADWAEIVSVSLKKKAECITFRTSGSSGKPKPCVHRVADLQEEASLHAAAYPDCRRVVTLVPRHHIYGFLWTVMLPAKLEVAVVDGRRWSPAKLKNELRAADLVVGTPAAWQHMSDNINAFPPSVIAVTSTAPCPAALFEQLQAQGLTLTEIYGSSETAGIGRRSEPRQPFKLLPFWNPGFSSTCLTRKSGECGVREFEIPDRLDWCDEKHFFVQGRKDNGVQVLGTNVFPERVADLIRSHAAVKECAVRLMRPDEGHRLKAFVVMHGESSAAERDEVKRWLRGELQPNERPASIAFGLAVPRNEMGKLADWDCSC
jgi:4-coumarate--CoA ligase